MLVASLAACCGRSLTPPGRMLELLGPVLPAIGDAVHLKHSGFGMVGLPCVVTQEHNCSVGLSSSVPWRGY